MKKIGLIFKETAKKKIEDNFKHSESVFIIKYAGLSSPLMSNLRQSLKKVHADVLVVKNTIAQSALKNLSLDSLMTNINGPCAMVFVKDEPIEVCRILYDFSKENEALKFTGGFFKDRILDKKDIETLAKLPSKDTLRFQAIMALKFPLYQLAIVLNQNLKKLVYCLEQIKNKKQNKGG